MRSEIDWERESGKWAGFDIEYDNIADINNVALNVKWTFRAGRKVKICSTS